MNEHTFNIRMMLVISLCFNPKTGVRVLYTELSSLVLSFNECGTSGTDILASLQRNHTYTTTYTHTQILQTTYTDAGKLAALKDQGRVYLLAATLRPETMAGQTNCWALPEGRYGAYKGLNNEVYVVTERAALNLSYQVFLWTCGCVNGGRGALGLLGW
jgi:hypothetical protein